MSKDDLTLEYNCPKDFSAMEKNEDGRFCTSCSKTVHDFTKSSNSAIVKTLQGSAEKICGHYFSHQIIQPKEKWKRDLISFYQELLNSKKRRNIAFRISVISLSIILTATGCHSRRKLSGMVGVNNASTEGDFMANKNNNLEKNTNSETKN